MAIKPDGALLYFSSQVGQLTGKPYWRVISHQQLFDVKGASNLISVYSIHQINRGKFSTTFSNMDYVH